MNKGIYEASNKETLQDGNLSPLLSDIMLIELDKEWEASELSFTYYADGCIIAVKSKNSAVYKARPYKDSKERLARKIKRLCKGNSSMDLDNRITQLNHVARGWVNYFKIGDMKKFLLKLSAHIRTMLGRNIWK